MTSIRNFSRAGFEFDQTIYLASIIDDEGHLEYLNDLELGKEKITELIQRLENDQQFLVKCYNKHLFFSIAFATKYFNPYIMIGWSKQMFRSLGEELKRKYWNLLREVARDCNATYVIIVDDPPGYFEDNFLEIDGYRLLDKKLPSGREYDIKSLWIASEKLDKLPQNASTCSLSSVGEGFHEYFIEA